MCDRVPMTALEPADEAPELMLGPATRLLWRTPDSVHLELGSQATVVEGLPVSIVRNVASAAPSPAPPIATLDEPVRHALAALTHAGYLWRRSLAPDDPRGAPPQPRLAGELTALAARHGADAAVVLAARRHASVAVFGTSRVAAHLAAVLAAAGVGRVSCVADGTVRLHQAMPGGATPDDEGSTLSYAADQALRRAAPEVDTRPPGIDERPDLTIVATDTPITEERRQALHASNAPYLAVTLGIDHGVVGPLVLPGLTSCLRCADLHRQDRDPAWSALAVQLTVERRHGPASDVAVATIVAGAAALQALSFLDGGEPAVLDATVELRMPDWRLRRRSWPPHPDCDCTDAVG